MAKSVGTEHGVAVSEHGLKADAISFWEGLVVALASTAPAYSLAAVIGSIGVARSLIRRCSRTLRPSPAAPSRSLGGGMGRFQRARMSS